MNIKISAEKREELGRIVREVWVKWAKEQSNPKESWLKPWEELTEPDKEVDRRIGEKLWQTGYIEASSLGSNSSEPGEE